MRKWIYVNNRPRYFKNGEEFKKFLKELINKRKTKDINK